MAPREQAYLFSAIRSHFFDQVRRARLVPIESLDAGDGHAEPSTARTDELIFADAQMIEQALTTLRPVEREVLLLFDVDRRGRLPCSRGIPAAPCSASSAAAGKN